MKWTIVFLALLCAFVSGCDRDIPLAALCQSQWYNEQIAIVQSPKDEFLAGERSFWCGKIVNVQNGIVTLKPFRKLAGFSNVRSNSLDLWFAEKQSAGLSVGTWIAARTERSLKNQYFVKDYRPLTQENAVPEKFTAIYEKILIVAIEHNWNLKVEMSDNGRTLTISNGVPRMTKFYEPKFKNGYTSTRTKDGVFFSENVFEYTVNDTKGILFKRIRLQNTPGGMVWEKNENDLEHVFKCGYDFDPIAFHEITGKSPTVSIWEMIRFSPVLESSGVIAMNPSTAKRREELQRAFDKAGISGKWKIGDLGSMIFYSDCRDFELDMPSINNDKPLTVPGPNPLGFIFSLSTPHEGPPMPDSPPILYTACPSFYYWKTVQRPGYLYWDQGKKLVWHTWNFEFGDELSNHAEVITKILQTIRSLPPWTLPQKGK